MKDAAILVFYRQAIVLVTPAAITKASPMLMPVDFVAIRENMNLNYLAIKNRMLRIRNHLELQSLVEHWSNVSKVIPKSEFLSDVLGRLWQVPCQLS